MLLPAAMDYLLHHPASNVNIEEFENACGVGVVVTAEEIKDAVRMAVAYLFYQVWLVLILNGHPVKSVTKPSSIPLLLIGNKVNSIFAGKTEYIVYLQSTVWFVIQFAYKVNRFLF